MKIENNIKTKIYLLMVLENEEYGNYSVFGVYNNKDKAEKEIIKQGNNRLIETWFNKKGIPFYCIEEWEIN